MQRALLAAPHRGSPAAGTQAGQGSAAPRPPHAGVGPLAPAPAAARAAAARRGDSCAGKREPAPSRQPCLLPAPLGPLPAATHAPGQEPTPFPLPLCWALGNNSANFPARLLNSRLFAFCFFFFSLFRTQLPALLSITVSAPSPSRALPALSARALGDHQSICADNRICFANNILSNVLGSPEQGALGEIL